LSKLWLRLSTGLTKTRTAIAERLQNLLPQGGRIEAETWEELEEILLAADVGVAVTEELIRAVKAERVASVADIRAALSAKLEQILQVEPGVGSTSVNSPLAILVVGVNGVGKTTSIAKLAGRYRKEGKRVILAACDTFRAAASEQLTVWANRVGADLIAHQEGSDPAAVAYDAVQAALARRADVLILDTAGRLQTKKNLMQELLKVRRVLGKARPDLPQETLLVLDATTGQNALSQARLFQEVVPLTGIILAKLDGTAKGGIAVAIQKELGIPIRWLGIGEELDDLEDFEPKAFVAALLEDSAERA
jgi:fused signal recognition particle receptor